MTTHLQIFLSSPGDVDVERQLVRDAIAELQREPQFAEAWLQEVSWDDPRGRTPLVAQLDPQSAVNLGLPVPSVCDVVVGIFWARMGSPLPLDVYTKADGTAYRSGTEFELEDAFAAEAGPDVLLYRRGEAPIWDDDDSRAREKRQQLARLEAYLAALRRASRYIDEYPGARDFKWLLKNDLRKILARRLKLRDLVLTGAPDPSAAGRFSPIVYVDRPEQTQPVLEHLLDPTPVDGGSVRVCALTGMGGLGKSITVTWITYREDIVQRFPHGRVWVTLGEESCDALGILNGWIETFGGVEQRPDSVESARSLLTSRLQGKKVLIVIDDVWQESRQAALDLMVPAPNVVYLLTSRSSKLIAEMRIGAEVFELDELTGPQSLELLGQELANAHPPKKLLSGDEPDALKLAQTVGHHPLALVLAAARIATGRDWGYLIAATSAEIAQLEKLESFGEEGDRYRSVLASLRLSLLDLPGEQWQKWFAWIGALAKDAPITADLGATLWEVDAGDAAEILSRFAGLSLLKRDDADRYRMHALTHDLARNLMSAPARSGETEQLPGLGLTLEEASRSLLGRYREQTREGLWHTLVDDGYIHDHLLWHLEKADDWHEFETLLREESRDGVCGWFAAREALGQTDGFLADVRRVWDHADRLLGAASDSEGRAKAAALQVHCALIVASINSLSAGLPAEVLAGAVGCGLMTLPAAAVFARQNPQVWSRVVALLALADVVSPEERSRLLADALAAARDADETRDRGEMLVEVVKRLPTKQALAIARSIQIPRSSAEALANVAERLSPEARAAALQEALGAADKTPDASDRAQALATVAKRLPEEERSAVLGRALDAARSVDDHEQRGHALGMVAGLLPAEERSQVLEDAVIAARSVDESMWRARALASVAEQLPEPDRQGLLDEALITAADIPHSRNRSRALWEVAQRLPAEAALEASARIEESWFRDWALAMVAKRLPPETALAIPRYVGQAIYRAEILGEVAQRLPTADRPDLIGEALSVARRINDARKRADALAEITKRLPEEEALVVARQIEEPSARSNALAMVARRLPADEALKVAREVRESNGDERPLAEVAKRLPAQRALEVARSIGDPRTCTLALAEVADRTPADEQPTVLGEAVRTARRIDDAENRATTLADLIERLPEGERRMALEDALRAAREIDRASPRARLLSLLAMRLPELEQQGVRREALIATRDIDAAEMRVLSVAQMLEGLPSEERPVVFREILDAARGIENPRRRADLLSRIATRLPEAERPILVGDAPITVPEEPFRWPWKRPRPAITEPSIEVPGQDMGLAVYELVNSLRATATQERGEWLRGLASILPQIEVVGGRVAIMGLKESIQTTGRWWP